ncbi:MAG: MFS transporter [Candidatus Amesbacteria bacterium]|nr:MFS transporter [Candidatus Amesbacteria bacterium]
MKSDFGLLLKNSNFVKLWLSQILSQITINLMTFIVLTRIFEATKSNVAVSMLWIASSLPALFFGPFSGAIVDNFSRRKMMIVTNIAQAISVASFLILKKYVFALYAVVFLYWLIDQLYLPSQQASLPSLIKGKLLASANGMFLLTQQATFLFGFGMGGLFLTVLGINNTVVFASILLLVAAISVYLLPKDEPKTKNFQINKFWRDFALGYKFIRSNNTVLLPLMVIIFSQIFVAIISSILPSYTRVELGLDLKHVSLVLVVPAAIGALLFTSKLPDLLKRYRKIMIIKFGLIGSATSLLLLAILPYLTRYSVFFGAVSAVLLGISSAAITVPSQTLLQEKTPAWFRGRVYGSLSFMLIIATSMPLLLAATLADVLGIPILLMIMACTLVLGFFFMHRKGDHVLANGFGI